MGNTIKTTLLLGAMTGLLVIFGDYFGGTQGMVIAFLFALLMNFGSYWYSDKIVLKMYRAREVTDAEAPELVGMVRSLSQRAQLPMPRVYIVPNESPNAFATGRNPQHAAVAVTSGILRIMNYEQLEGVLAHELGHVKHRDTLISAVAATLAGVIMMLARGRLPQPHHFVHPVFVHRRVAAIAGKQRDRHTRDSREQDLVDRLLKHVQTGNANDRIDVATDDDFQYDRRPFGDEHLVSHLFRFRAKIRDAASATSLAIQTVFVVVRRTTLRMFQAMWQEKQAARRRCRSDLIAPKLRRKYDHRPANIALGKPHIFKRCPHDSLHLVLCHWKRFVKLGGNLCATRTNLHAQQF